MIIKEVVKIYSVLGVLLNEDENMTKSAFAQIARYDAYIIEVVDLNEGAKLFDEISILFGERFGESISEVIRNELSESNNILVDFGNWIPLSRFEVVKRALAIEENQQKEVREDGAQQVLEQEKQEEQDSNIKTDTTRGVIIQDSEEEEEEFDFDEIIEIFTVSGVLLDTKGMSTESFYDTFTESACILKAIDKTRCVNLFTFLGYNYDSDECKDAGNAIASSKKSDTMVNYNCEWFPLEDFNIIKTAFSIQDSK